MSFAIVQPNLYLSLLPADNRRFFSRTPTHTLGIPVRILFPFSGYHQLRFRGNVAGGAGFGSMKRRRLTSIAGSLELPLLPFNMNEVFVPTESKTLHLYEARYLALLEESLQTKNMFVHFVLDPISFNETTTEASFAARYGCLVIIESVERLDVGALVSIRGVSRVKILRFLRAEPYLFGEVRPMRDVVTESCDEITSKVAQVKESIWNLNTLEIKLKAPKEARLRTRVYDSLSWAETEPSFECDESFVPSLVERVSFAAFQPVSGATQSELSRLQKEKLRAMELKDTIQRLERSVELIKENMSSVAAKLAIQSLDAL